MVRNKAGVLVPEANAMEANIRKIVTMHDENYSRERFSEQVMGALPLVLPNVPGHKRVIYTIYEYDPLLDSSNMTMDDWIQIAKDVKLNYRNFDGSDDDCCLLTVLTVYSVQFCNPSRDGHSRLHLLCSVFYA